MNEDEAKLYDEYSGLIGRLKAASVAAKYSILDKAADVVLKKMKNIEKRGILGKAIDSLESYIGALKHETFSIKKHEYGKLAGRINIPIIGKFFQNLWSFYYLSRGITNIDTIYTLRVGEVEYPFFVTTSYESEPPTDELKRQAKKVIGRESEHAEDLIKTILQEKDKYENKEAVNASVYAELTDFDIMQVEDLDKFANSFMAYELWVLGRDGRRFFVTTTDEGYEIYRYEKPSRLPMLRAYLDVDFRYTIYDMAVGAAETLVKGLAKQRLYEREVRTVIGRTIRERRDLRPDNVANPTTSYIKGYVDLS
jgi:hypothetical protein